MARQVLRRMPDGTWGMVDTKTGTVSYIDSKFVPKNIEDGKPINLQQLKNIPRDSLLEQQLEMGLNPLEYKMQDDPDFQEGIDSLGNKTMMYTADQVIDSDAKNYIAKQQAEGRNVYPGLGVGFGEELDASPMGSNVGTPRAEIAQQAAIADQVAEVAPNIDQPFLQTKEIARQKNQTKGSGDFSAGLGQLSSAAQGMADQMSEEDAALSGGLSGLSTGISTTAGLSMLGVGGLTTGVGAAAALTPLGIGVIAGSAILGAVMGSRKAKKAKQAAKKERKRQEKLLKEARVSKAFSDKMQADSQAYDNLQRAVSSALRRDNQIKIRT